MHADEFAHFEWPDIADCQSACQRRAMGRLARLSQQATDHAPAIILINCGVAILYRWSGRIPDFPIYVMALATLFAAVLVLVFRAFPLEFSTKEELGFRRNRDLFWYDISYSGLDERAYGLAIPVFIAMVASGFLAPNVVMVFATGLLLGAWSAATRKWPKGRRESQDGAAPMAGDGDPDSAD
jgi:hypothetical protein